jgi:hypothetical protein
VRPTAQSPLAAAIWRGAGGSLGLGQVPDVRFEPLDLGSDVVDATRIKSAFGSWTTTLTA